MINDFITRDVNERTVRVYGGCRKMFDRESKEFRQVCDEFWVEVSKYERFKREHYLN